MSDNIKLRYPSNGPKVAVQRNYYEGRITAAQYVEYCSAIQRGENPKPPKPSRWR